MHEKIKLMFQFCTIYKNKYTQKMRWRKRKINGIQLLMCQMVKILFLLRFFFRCVTEKRGDIRCFLLWEIVSRIRVYKRQPKNISGTSMTELFFLNATRNNWKFLVCLLFDWKTIFETLLGNRAETIANNYWKQRTFF